MGKVNRTQVVSLSLKYLRRLAFNDAGKYKYEKELNEVLMDIFGAKNIATKMGPKSGKSKILKCIDNIDFEAMVSMLADNKTTSDLRLCVGFRRAIDSNRYTKSEAKRIKKAYKRLINKIVSSYGVKKASFSDVLSQVDKILGDDYDDYEDYDGYDDDDAIDLDDLDEYDIGSIWEDDDGPISRSRRRYSDKRKGDGNRLAALLYGQKYGSNRDPDYDDIVADNMKKITTVLENLNDRLDRIEYRDDDDDDDDLDDREDYYLNPPPKRLNRPSNRGRGAPVGSAIRRSINDDDYDDYWEGGYADDLDEDEDSVHLPGIDPEKKQTSSSDDDATRSMVKAMSIQISGAIDDLGDEIGSVKNDLANWSNRISGTIDNLGNDINSVKSDVAVCMKNVTTIMSDIYDDVPIVYSYEKPDAEPIVPPPNRNDNSKLIRDSEVKAKVEPSSVRARVEPPPNNGRVT